MSKEYLLELGINEQDATTIVNGLEGIEWSGAEFVYDSDEVVIEYSNSPIYLFSNGKMYKVGAILVEEGTNGVILEVLDGYGFHLTYSTNYYTGDYSEFLEEEREEEGEDEDWE